MSDKVFEPALRFQLEGREVVLADVESARDLLMDARWPERGPRHREALDLCHKILAGERSVEEASRALDAAFAEAGEA